LRRSQHQRNPRHIHTQNKFMKANLDYPSFPNLISVLEGSPSSIFIYIRLWKNRKGYQTVTTKEDIQEKYLIHEDNFLKHLFDLHSVEVISFEEKRDSFVITHQIPTIHTQGYMLC
jgi:hypothetical protein